MKIQQYLLVLLEEQKSLRWLWKLDVIEVDITELK